MATKEDIKKADEESSGEDEPEARAEEEAEGEGADKDGDEKDGEKADEEKEEAKAEKKEATDEGEDEEEAAPAGGPVQLGYKRYVYAAYMAAAMVSGFLVAKIGHVAWYRLGQWKPEFGEPKDEILYPIAAVVGVLVALYYYRKPSARQYANEVAEELSKVTWPTRKEVTNSTTVVVLTTIFATIFFALMDRFWGYVTDKFYNI